MMQTIKKGYKQTEIGVIPEDWEVKSIINVAPLQRGFDLTSEQIREGIYPVVYSNGIVNFHNKFQAKGPGIITGRSGTIGKVTFIENNYWPHNTSLWVTNFKNNNPKFIFYLFLMIKLERFAIGSGVPTLNRNDVHDYRIPIPPLSEQTAIAETLSDTDALITSIEKLIAKKRSIKQGAMQQLLQPKDGWEIEPIKNIASIGTGSKNTQDKIDIGEYPFFVRSETIERINSYSFDGEAILIAGDGVGTGKVMHYFNGKFDFHQRVYKISDFKESISGFYFFLYFKNNFLNRVMQMTAKSSVDSIRMDMISEMKISFPPTKEEQTRIATILSDMDAEIEALEQKLEKYKKIKQGMMQELLTGKIRLV